MCSLEDSEMTRKDSDLLNDAEEDNFFGMSPKKNPLNKSSHKKIRTLFARELKDLVTKKSKSKLKNEIEYSSSQFNNTMNFKEDLKQIKSSIKQPQNQFNFDSGEYGKYNILY